MLSPFHAEIYRFNFSVKLQFATNDKLRHVLSQIVFVWHRGAEIEIWFNDSFRLPCYSWSWCVMHGHSCTHYTFCLDKNADNKFWTIKLRMVFSTHSTSWPFLLMMIANLDISSYSLLVPALHTATVHTTASAVKWENAYGNCIHWQPINYLSHNSKHIGCITSKTTVQTSLAKCSWQLVCLHMLCIFKAMQRMGNALVTYALMALFTWNEV